MKSQRRFLGLAFLVAATGAGMTVVACSSDPGAAPTTTPDAAPTPTTRPVSDAGPPPVSCFDAGHRSGTCHAASCTAQLGGPATCVNDQCVAIKTAECQTVLGPANDDNALFVGMLASTRGENASIDTARIAAAGFAVNEINATAGGAVSADGCTRRPVVAVVCDDSNGTIPGADGGADSGTLSRVAATHHLAVELGVAAILGSTSPAATIDTFENAAAGAHTLYLAPLAGSPEIPALAGATANGTRLLWRLVPDDSLQDKAQGALAQQVFAQLVAGGKTTLKAAVVARNDAWGTGRLNALKASATLNGKPWSDPSNAANVVEVTYDATKPPPASAWQTVLAQQPDVIFYYGYAEAVSGIVAPYEDANVGTDAGTDGLGNKPIWVTTTDGERPELLAVIKSHPSMRGRVRGTSALVATNLATDFYARYSAQTPNAGPFTVGMTETYDSIYLATFALTETGLGFGPVASSTVAGAMTSLVGGASTDVGPTALVDGLEKARQKIPLQVNGTSGPLAFDPKTGTSPGDYAIWCVHNDSTGNAAFSNATGMTWSAASSALTGTFACP